MAEPRPLRVLVAEDSATTRALLEAILSSDPGISVVGSATDGRTAVAMATRLRPDVITMDIEMPGMNGLLATERIMAEVPTPIVIISSSVRGQEMQRSLDATEAGALCVIAKPEHPLAPGFDAQARQLVATVKAMAAVKVVRRWIRPGTAATPVPPPRPWQRRERTRIVAMAASTGGPAVLHDILRRLPAAFPVPIVLVQHISQGFAEPFATWLDGGCALRVRMAAHGVPLQGGTVYVAPDGGHLGVDAHGVATVKPGAPVGGFLPAATCLFESVAKRYGAGAVGVILSGMGGDGVPGLRRLHAAGAPVLAQSEESSVVYGMPGEAVRAGVVTEVLGPAAIAERLMTFVAEDVDADTRTRR